MLLEGRRLHQTIRCRISQPFGAAPSFSHRALHQNGPSVSGKETP